MVQKENQGQYFRAQVYADKNKVAGVNINDPNETQKIYQRYLKAFKKGVYNYIKEEIDPITQETIPRKYFSGGETFLNLGAKEEVVNAQTVTPAMLSSIGDAIRKGGLVLILAGLTWLGLPQTGKAQPLNNVNIPSPILGQGCPVVRNQLQTGFSGSAKETRYSCNIL